MAIRRGTSYKLAGKSRRKRRVGVEVGVGVGGEAAEEEEEQSVVVLTMMSISPAKVEPLQKQMYLERRKC